MIKEIQHTYASGHVALVVLPVLLLADVWLFVSGIQMLNAGSLYT